MAYYKERIGYRANARNFSINLLSSNKPIRPNDGFVTVFAERRNNEVSLGEFGGDSYPLVDEYDLKIKLNSNLSLGIVLVADGVGNANFNHPSLEKYLDTRIDEFGIKDDLDKAKLLIFLQDLYGAEIFNEEYKHVLEYALKCFSDVPADGYFASDADHWYDDINFQCVMPFYKRDSQSLGSRIICIGLYKTAVTWVKKNINKFQSSSLISDEKKIEALIVDLKATLEEFAFGDGENSFRTRTQLKNQKGEMMFSFEDAPNADKRDRYFLAATVAAWFYIYEPGDIRKGKPGCVNAVSINIGDARTYLINTKDGVRQVSVDDAFPFNDMRGFVHRGQSPKSNKEYCDGSFFARMIRSDLPCALFACSDGIYETVCNVPGRDILPYGESHGAKDILFEKNLLEAARRSYSFDDFKRELIFTFYAQQEKIERVIESCESSGIDAKRDDGGTAAVRFFGSDSSAPIEIFKELRDTISERGGTTSLDLLWQLLIDQYNVGKPIPYSEPQITPKDQRMGAQKLHYAIGNFKATVLDKLVAAYSQAYDSMTSASASTVWGIPQGDRWTRPKWKLEVGNILVIILDTALKDWEDIHSKQNGIVPAEWSTSAIHEHVIFDVEMLDMLNQIDFAVAYQELNADPPLTEDDLQIILYDWYQEALFGITPKGADNPGYEYNNRNYIWGINDALRTPDLWCKTLGRLREDFYKELEKQTNANSDVVGEEIIQSASSTSTVVDAGLTGDTTKQTKPNTDSDVSDD